MKGLLEKLRVQRDLSDDEFLYLLSSSDPGLREDLAALARDVREQAYGTDVYIRGLIEFTNYCKNDCFYCGIRRSNQKAQRYRLTKEEILSCTEQGYALGFRTFVLQGGEDPYFTDDRIAEIVSEIKKQHPDCAVTLSIGEKEKESYQRFFDAGADRYLLRHETADASHYAKIHPQELSLQHRMDCLFSLKEIGFQVGCGMMIGSPYQTPECLLADLRFLQKLQPDMVGIGPFIPHKDTPFRDKAPGTFEQTILLLSMIRLMLPNVLLPATTALGTIHPQGREMGLLAGANVVMPNLSPVEVRGKYLLYDNKICTGEEAAQCIECLKRRVSSTGYRIVVSRGDAIGHTR